MIIEEIHVRNYKVLRDIHLKNMPSFAVFLGANGSGKSTLLDVFSFIQDCVLDNVEEAVQRRGGQNEVFSRGTAEPLQISISFRISPKSNRLTYTLQLVRANHGYTFVKRESLQELLKPRRSLVLFSFVDGVGRVMSDGPSDSETRGDYQEEYQLENPDILAMNALGQFTKYSTVSRVNQAIENWYCTSAFATTKRVRRKPRETQEAQPSSLTTSGNNLGKVSNELFHSYPDVFERVVKKTKAFIPGLEDITPEVINESKIDLFFKDMAFNDSFPEKSMSDGARKIFSTMLLLNEPVLHSLLTIEEPENELYPQIIRPLAENFRTYSEQGVQVLVSTHSPDFVNALEPGELYWMEKKNGFAEIVHASDDTNLVSQNEGGDLLGLLWRQGFFGKIDPL